MIKRFINTRPVLTVGLYAAFGIFAAFLTLVYGYMVLIICGIAAILPFAVYFFAVLFKNYPFKKKRCFNALVLLGISVAAFIAFGAVFKFKVERFDKAEIVERNYNVAGVIADFTPHDGYDTLVIKKVFLDGKKSVMNVRLNVTKNDGAQSLKVGDKITFYDELKNLDIYYYGKLSYSNIQQNIKYSASLNYNNIKISGHVFNIFYEINNAVLNALKSGMSESVYPVCYAMITGNSSLIEKGTLEAFRFYGIAHIFAVSGLHIGIIAGALAFVFRKCGVKKRVYAPIIVLITAFFSGICGFSPSSVRAVIMCAVALTSGSLGMKKDALTNISLSAIIVLAISPVYLFDIGFQLSYASVTALAIAVNPLSKWLKKVLPKLKIKFVNSLSASIVASLATLPIAMYYFNGSPLLSVVCNLIFVPVISVLFVILLVGLIFALITTLCGFFLFVPDILFGGVIKLLTALDLSGFYVSGIKLGIFVIAFIAVFIVLSGLLKLSFKAKRLFAFVLAAFTCFGATFLTVSNYNTVKIYAFNDNGAQFVCISEKDENYLIATTFSYDYDFVKLRSLLSKVGAKKISAVILLGATNKTEYLTESFSKIARVEKVYQVLSYENFISGNAYAENLEANVDNVLEGINVYYPNESGKAVVLGIGGVTIAVSGGLNYADNFKLTDKKIDLAITGGEHELIKAINNVDKIVGFKREDGIVSSEGNGNLFYFVKMGLVIGGYKLQNDK